MTFLRRLDAKARRMLSRLSPRERGFLVAGAAGLAVFVFFQFLLFPLYDHRAQLRRQVSDGGRIVAEMGALEERYVEVRETALAWNALLKKRPRDFSLFSHVEKLAGKANVMGMIAFIKPSEAELPDSDYRLSRVEIKLVGLNIQQLVDYLYLLESGGDAIRVSRLSLERKGDATGTLDVVMLVETPIVAPKSVGSSS